MNMMVVDDDRLNLVLAERHLKDLYPECTVFICNEPLKAHAMLESIKVDILFLDIIMPKMNGIELLESIRSNHQYDDIYIIMLTSMTDQKYFTACFDKGANDYVSKPIQIMEFKARLKAAVQIRSHVKLVHEMYNKVKSQNQELKTLNAKIKDAQFHMVQQEKLASIGELAAGIAHEINNPIGYVGSNLATLKVFYIKIMKIVDAHEKCMNTMIDMPDLPDNIRQSIETVHEMEKAIKLPFIMEELENTIQDSLGGVERVAKIVQTLRNFARTGLNEEYAPCLIDDIIEETLLIVDNESKYSIDIHHIRGDALVVVCNRGQIGQVLLNILINAIHAIKSQNRTERGNITIIVNQIEENIRITIRDDGPGIPEPFLMKIFDPFFTTKDVGQGTGLGLSISHDIIVNKHHGKLTVSNHSDGGAEFIIQLPIHYEVVI